jgi:hypothetical protein
MASTPHLAPDIIRSATRLVTFSGTGCDPHGTACPSQHVGSFTVCRCNCHAPEQHVHHLLVPLMLADAPGAPPPSSLSLPCTY